jgi:hypothetical protein
MGTNYYWYPWMSMNEGVKHIGKSSAGWCFALHVDREDDIRSLSDWLRRFAMRGSRIENEYGDPITTEEMVHVICCRGNASAEGGVERSQVFLAANHALEGPRGLLRSKLDSMCVGYGRGTWDLIEGEFS